MQIDPHITIDSIIQAWTTGYLPARERIIDVLESDHPGLTAAVIAQGIADGRLDTEEVNSIANRLLDKRIAIVQEQAAAQPSLTLADINTNASNQRKRYPGDLNHHNYLP